MDEMTITLSSPITDEQWNAITDVDFDNTDRIWFHTKHGKDVEFVKRKKGRWYDVGSLSCRCSECGCKSPKEYSFCPNCGADMRGEDGEEK